MKIARERFQGLVEEAVAALPPFFKEKIENVAIVVEDRPSPELADEHPDELLLGLYQGVPRSARSVWSDYHYPDMISIYQGNIEAICHNEQEIVEQVRQTVMHEIGHYFGFGEEALRAMGL
jgi:predicted Zn-dependent protease with MMP-like domain